MELTIETGFAMPVTVKNTTEAYFVSLFKAMRNTLDAMKMDQSVEIPLQGRKIEKVRRDMIWIINKYGLTCGKRFVVGIVPAADTKAEHLRCWCTGEGNTPEAFKAGDQYKEVLEAAFKSAVEDEKVIVPDTTEGE